jgi:hypothetical protein
VQHGHVFLTWLEDEPFFVENRLGDQPALRDEPTNYTQKSTKRASFLQQCGLIAWTTNMRPYRPNPIQTLGQDTTTGPRLVQRSRACRNVLFFSFLEIIAIYTHVYFNFCPRNRIRSRHRHRNSRQQCVRSRRVDEQEKHAPMRTQRLKLWLHFITVPFSSTFTLIKDLGAPSPSLTHL